jgi:N-sulfoglucosamine sulfohydrolase
MMKRFTLVSLLVLLALVCHGAEQRPNFLWISCEDMSPDIGCYGAPDAHTPNLDRLAADGIRFTRAFSSAPVCAPSRSSIITGMYASTIGTHHMRSKAVLPDYVKCFTEYLRAEGYYCTNNVKTDYNFDHPRSAWDESSRNAHWRKRPPGAPFFAVFNTTTTHESRFHMTDEQFEREVSAVPAALRHDPAKAQLPPYYPDTPIVRKHWARYQDMITAMDIRKGQILKELEDDGLATSTIVFFWSDHGRGLPRGKRWLYDSGLHVPLIVRFPDGQSSGSTRDDLVSLMDLGPTLLSLAGIKPPDYMQGRALMGEYKAPAPEFLFFTRDRMDETHDMIRSLRGERFRYIRNFFPERPYSLRTAYGEKSPVMQEIRRLHEDGQLTGPQALFMRPQKPAEEFYDTSSDPHEINNLVESEKHAAEVARMRRALDDWMKATGDLGPIPEEELKRRWGL